MSLAKELFSPRTRALSDLVFDWSDHSVVHLLGHLSTYWRDVLVCTRPPVRASIQLGQPPYFCDIA
jgi:hypothetical protein